MVNLKKISAVLAESILVLAAMVACDGARGAEAAAAGDNATKAKEILNRYLATVHPKGPSQGDPYDPKADAEVNKARMARMATLAELNAVPKEAVSAAEQALFVFKQTTSTQRYEIVAFLGDNIHTPECAELLHRVLQYVREPDDEDAALYEELARSSAVQGLRKMARCVDRSGGQRIQRGPEFEPKVRGLVPYLISAADDKAERVRISALYGLADSRDPAAQAALRKKLQDSSRSVRLHAACFLTEFQDASGLPEMRKSLDYLRRTPPGSSFGYFPEAELLLASLERLVGKNFGKIPLNPILCSVDHGEVQRYKELLDTWHTWWAWQPNGQSQ